MSLVILKILLVGGSFLSLFLLERVFPYRNIKPIEQNRHVPSNLLLWLANSLLSIVFILAFTKSISDLIPYLSPNVVTNFRNNFLNPITQLLLDLIIYDAFLYWWHRFNHQIPLLWRFHRVHHLDEHLDTTTAVRFHPIEVLLSSFVRVPVILLFAIPFSSLVIIETCVLLSSLFQHSNLRLPHRLQQWLSIVMVTPEWHFMHHEPDRRNTDSHYGNLLTLWDRIFFSQAYGKPNQQMRLGLPNWRDLNIFLLLISPFINNKTMQQWQTKKIFKK